jgi:hypothetical protein
LGLHHWMEPKMEYQQLPSTLSNPLFDHLNVVTFSARFCSWWSKSNTSVLLFHPPKCP